MVESEELLILASCLLRPMNRNSVLDDSVDTGFLVNMGTEHDNCFFQNRFK